MNFEHIYSQLDRPTGKVGILATSSSLSTVCVSSQPESRSLQHLFSHTAKNAQKVPLWGLRKR